MIVAEGRSCIVTAKLPGFLRRQMSYLYDRLQYYMGAQERDGDMIFAIDLLLSLE